VSQDIGVSVVGVITSHAMETLLANVLAGDTANVEICGTTSRDVASNVSTNSGSGPTTCDLRPTTGLIV